MKEGKTGLTSQTTAPGTIPCGTVLYNRPATNSIVGADSYIYNIVGAGQNTRVVRPPMCLWASTVLWAMESTIPGEYGKAMPPVGETIFLQVLTSSNLEESSSTSHMYLTFCSDINIIADPHHCPVLISVDNKA